ncbi:branched-chain amino acid ABC transporter permease [Nitratifractor sp.]
MTELFAFLLTGVTVGFVYALVGMGFTVIYNASGIINFAQGEFLMAGGMIAVFLSLKGLPYPVVFVVAIVATALLGALLSKLARISKDRSQESLIILTLGYAITLRGTAEVCFDKELHTLPPIFGEGHVSIMGATLSYQALLVIGASMLIVAGLWFFFRRTRTGKAMIAVSLDPDAARLMGIDLAKIWNLSFALAAAIAAAGGILLTPIASTNYEIGIMLGLKGFAAAITGGLANPFGAVAGGLVLGVAEALVAGYLSSEYKDAVAFVIMLAILFFRPDGLFGYRGIERA